METSIKMSEEANNLPAIEGKVDRRQFNPGRPLSRGSLDDEAVVQEVCDRLIAGEGIANICADAHMPAETTLYGRMARDEVFRSRIARAREDQQEAEIERTVAMADAATPEDWQVVKLRIWARQWRAAKLAPKKYSEKIIQAHEGAVPVKVVIDKDDSGVL